MKMESYKGYYEYPQSQAAIQHVLPHNNVGGAVTSAKGKRSWGNILRIPGKTKKEREAPQSHIYSTHGAIYSPPFNLPQSHNYPSQNYVTQNTPYLTNSQYREPIKTYYSDAREKYRNCNNTYSRASVPFTNNVNPNSRSNGKNTVKYTDWFGSVVGRKAPVRPPIPPILNSPPIKPETNYQAFPSWDTYVTIQSPPPPNAIEIPALIPVQTYNVCTCPDQIYSSRSKKKKKCKKCGKKYGTIKNATAIGSYSRIRPAIPPNFFKVPVNTPWPWPQTPKPVYSHPLPAVTQGRREEDEDEDSSPPTPETVRSISGRSSESNATITQEGPYSQRYIPSPPSVPAPSVPKLHKTSSQKDDKRTSIISSTKTAYDLVLKDKNAQLSSDTDELSDNAVDSSWENLERNLSPVRNGGKRNLSKKSNENRVSIISIGGEGQNEIIYNENEKNISKDDSNKIKIYNNHSTKMIENNYRNHSDSNIYNENFNGYHNDSDERVFDIYPEEKNNYTNKKLGSTSSYRSSTDASDTRFSNFNNLNSSHYNRKYKGSNGEKNSNNTYTQSENKVLDRDTSKVVSIAGQRILLDKKQSKKQSKSSHKYNQGNKKNNGSKAEISPTEISDWDSLQELVCPVHFEIPREDEESSFQVSSPNKSRSSSSSNYINNNEQRKLLINRDINEVIHEEEEEEEDDKESTKNTDDLAEDCIENLEDDHEDRMKTSNDATSEEHSIYGEYQGREKKSCIEINGYQPSLSELLQVKSILKRPNSLDTSSETDSDFYQPALTEFKQNIRKKKSVQFRPSNDINSLAGKYESSEKFRAIKNELKENGTRKRNGFVNNESDSEDIYPQNGESENKDEKCEIINGNWDPDEEKNLGIDEAHDFENKVPDPIHETREIVSDQPERKRKQNLSEGKSSLRRTSSHRQTVDASLPAAFSDTYRLRQPASRPSVLFLDNANAERKPTRKAPPPPKVATSPLRPTVPPPPPPLPPPSSTSSTVSLNNTILESEKALSDEGCENEATSSLSSTSFSPPPSPPPPLPSSPPPLPSSSPPPLEDYPNLSNEISSPKIGFSSFVDPKSPVSISARTQQIQIPEDSQPFQDLTERFPPSSTSSSSIFGDPDINEKSPATIKGRIRSTRPYNSNSPSVLKARTSQAELRRENVFNSGQNKSRGRDPFQRNSFLSGLVGEGDADERFSDHIYEELPSLPSSPSESLPNIQEKSIFDGASKYEILEFLQDARNRVNAEVEEGDDLPGINSLSNELVNMGMDEEDDQAGGDGQDDLLTSRYTDGRSSNRSSNSESSENSGLLRSDKEKLSVGEIERTDSGVGSETSKSLVSLRRNVKAFHASSGNSPGCLIRERDLPPCDDCDSPVETKVTNSGLMFAPLVCRRCSRRRQERKEILTEIMETEVKYGRDLKVMMDQFCRPMRVAGLLSREHLEKIFINIDELIEHNRYFSLQLRDAFEIAVDQGDEDLLTVNVAKLFLQASSMLHAFQNYCVRQGAASILLQNLEKEKELLRIFLKVSQMENTLLRRMNLHSFLMVPVQRVTKYPLLLARLYKATPPSHPSREDCRRAREKIELYLQHINNETKEMSPTKLWRRISMSVGSSSPQKCLTNPLECDTTLKLRKVVLEVLGWSDEEACVVREGRLLCLPPESSNWTRRGRGLKMATVQMVLATQGRPKFTLEEKVPEDGLVTPCDLGIKEAAILAFKDHRLTKTALIREPWLLSQTVITWDGEGETECFEVTDLTSPRDTFIFKDRECVGTEEWFRSVQFHALSVGVWRRRRPALANIMINGANRP